MALNNYYHLIQIVVITFYLQIIVKPSEIKSISSKEITIDLADPDLDLTLPIYSPLNYYQRSNKSEQISYSLASNDDSSSTSISSQGYPFVVNSANGDLTLVDPKAIDGSTFDLTILMTDEISQVKTPVIRLIITVIHQSTNSRSTRSKRQATSDSKEFRTQLTLQLIKGDPDKAKPGDSLDYSVGVSLPSGREADLYIEIFSREPLNAKYSPVLSIYNVSFVYDSRTIKLPKKSAPKSTLSRNSANVYDRALMNLDGVENLRENGNTLVIKFSVLMVRNDEAKHKSRHHITVGAEYQGARFIWIGQDEVVYNKVRIEPTISGSIIGPDELALGSAAVYNLMTKVAIRSDPIVVEAFAPNNKYEPENRVSMGQIGLGKLGDNFAAMPKSPDHYTTDRSSTSSKSAYYRSILKMGMVTSLAARTGTLERDTESEKNLLEFRIPIYALDYPSSVDQAANVTVRIIVSGKVRFTQTLAIRLVSRPVIRPSSNLIKFVGDVSPKSVAVGDLVSVYLNASLARVGTLSDLEIEVKRGEGSIIGSCGARFLPLQSSPNLPYLNSSWFPPKIISETGLTFSFDGIVAIELYPGYPENVAQIELVIQIEGKPETETVPITIEASISGSSGSDSNQATPVIFETSVAVATEPEDVGQLKVNFDKSVPWKEIHGTGGISFETGLLLPVDGNFSSVDLKLREVDESGQPVVTSSLEICRFEIAEIGNGLPCTKAIENSIQSQANNISGHLNETKVISFGNICSKEMPSRNTNKERTVTTYLTFKASSTLETPSTTAQLEVSWTGDPSNGPWVQRIPISVIVGSEPSSSSSKAPRIHVTKTVPGATGIGQSTTGSIMILLASQTVADYSVEVFPTNSDSNSSICSIWVKSVGHNMPCFNGKPKTDLEVRRKGLNTKGTLRLGVIGHHGPLRVTLPSEDEEEADKIRLVAMVALSETATGDERFDVVVKSGKFSERSAFIVPVNRFPKPLKTLLDHFEIIDGSSDPLAIPIDGPASVRLRFKLRPVTMVQPVIIFSKSDAYSVTDFEVTSIGDNYPCYSPFSANKDKKKGHFTLGVISNANINRSAEANWIEVTSAIRSNKHLKPGQKIEFEVVLKIPGAEWKRSYRSTLIAVEKVNSIPPKMAWINESSSETKLSVRQAEWISFNITTTPDWRSQFTVQATGELIDGRPSVSVRGLRVSRVGSNIPCGVPKIIDLKLDQRANTVTGTFDYLANFGFSHRLEATTDLDDTIEIEVLTQMMSHPSALTEDRRSQVNLKFLTQKADSSDEKNLEIMAEGDRYIRAVPGTEGRPLIDLEANLLGNPVYVRSDQISIKLKLVHSSASKREPIDGFVRFYLPRYINFHSLDNSSQSQVTVEKRPNGTSFDLKIPVILFWETIELKVNLIIDPNNIIGYGRGHIPTTIPFAIFEGQTLISKMKHIQFDYNSEECFTKIELDDCQIIASSSINQTYGPGSSKIFAKNFWIPSPASSFDHDYLEYDFISRARVSGLQFRPPPAKSRRVTSFHLEVSDDGTLWQSATSSIKVYESNEPMAGLIERRVGPHIETRYLRIVFDKVDQPRSPNDLLQIKVDLMGCYLEPKTGSCSSQKWTWYDDNLEHLTRHFLYDADHDILYGCHFLNSPNNTECFRSKDGGDSWQRLPSMVHSLVGLDTATGRIIGLDTSQHRHLYSRDGVKWSPLAASEVSLVMSSETLVKVKLIGWAGDKWNLTPFDIKHSGHTKLLWNSACH